MTGGLHRPVDVRTLSGKGRRETVVADAREREALAEANGAVSVESFEAEVLVAPWNEDGVRVTGTVRATAVQTCVVTLEPVKTIVDEPVELVLVPDGSSEVSGDASGELVIDAEGDDPPDTFVPPMVDIGAIAAEFFALGLDPYPRAPDASLPTNAADERASPFAALRALKEGSN